MKYSYALFILTILTVGCKSSNTTEKRHGIRTFEIPKEYLKEAENIPSFWITSVDDVNSFLKESVKKGKVEIIGTTAGGRPISAVFYGQQRSGKGTTTLSGALGCRDITAYTGPDFQKKVYLSFAAIHGGEFEGIMGMINLISVIETGRDLSGKEWPQISETVTLLDRIILIPIFNLDGRARIPVRMEALTDNENAAEFLNTGGNPDGTLTGWPQVMRYIPSDFSRPGFPGGYPNDAGVNLYCDDFFGRMQPETRALLDLCEREKPDLVINMHTGSVYMRMDRPFAENALMPVFDSLFVRVHSALALHGLRQTADPKIEVDPDRALRDPFGIDGALNLHCGTLSVLMESPSHAFRIPTGNGSFLTPVPEKLLEAQLISHQEAMRFLAGTGGRYKWAPATR